MREKILSLINFEQEGSYWDFKKEWYSEGNKTNLLHDIICMANNLSSEDGYIIIGVDEEDNYSIVDTTSNKTRKNTQQLVTFLRDKNFSGGVRPTVYVEEFSIENKIIDVIIIKNDNNTPYYLSKTFNGVRANHIYTRIQDTNTPIDSSADLDKVEYLWRKRFGLIHTPLERFKRYLENYEDWIDSSSLSMHKYFKYFPEFTIDYGNEYDKTGYEYYLFSQTDSRPNWTNIMLRYHQTILVEFQGVFLDGGRYFAPTPELDGISFSEKGEWDITFRHYLKDSFLFKLNRFFYFNRQNKNGWSQETEWSRKKFLDVVLIFESDKEKKLFKLFVQEHQDKIEINKEKIHLPYLPDKIDGYIDKPFHEDYSNALVLKKMLNDFRSIKNN